MSKEKLIEEIKSSLEQLSRQYDVFTWQNRIPETDELDMLKNKMLRLCDKLSLLQQTENNVVAAEPVVIKETVAVVQEQPAIVVEKIAPVVVEAPVVHTETKIVAEEKIEARIMQPIIAVAPVVEEIKQVLKEETVIIETKTTVVAEVQTSRTETFKESHGTVAELFKDEESIHDKIGAGHNDFAIADKLKLTPVSDLVKAIGLNEKFLFISELFKNDSALFHQMIDKINGTPTYQEAYMVFDSEVAIKNGLDKSSPAYQSFLDLMHRRFM